MEEEIKLIILLIVTLCTLFKVRSTWKIAHPLTINQQQPSSMKEEAEKEVQVLPPPQRRQFIEDECSIFNRIMEKHMSAVKKGKDVSIYEKAIKVDERVGSDHRIIYNNGYYYRSPFPHTSKQLILNNEQYGKKIVGWMDQKRQSIMQEEEAMELEGKQMQSQKNTALLVKKKGISKTKKFGRRAKQTHRYGVQFKLDLERKKKKKIKSRILVEKQWKGGRSSKRERKRLVAAS